MPILVNKNTRVICQGITGAYGGQHAKGCFLYGTRLVGGVTPGKGGQKFEIDDRASVPVFDTVHQAVRETGADATMIFVPPGLATDAVLEAAAAGIRVICAITEGIPVQDMVRCRALLDEHNARLPEEKRSVLIGPNCPGIITPGPKTGSGGASGDLYSDPSKGGGGCKIGIMPGYIHKHISESTLGKSVGIVSRSGTLTYEAVWQTSRLGLAQSTCIGIGGDPVRGMNHIDCIRMLDADPDTHGILMIGEIGGSDETDAATFVKQHVRKPVAAFIAGRTAPPGRRMGHAGAIVGGADDTADAKIAALKAAGVEVAMSPAEMGQAMARAMKLG
ncbi:MAG: succinate--CoA ligase subunit alpha [Phycisphaeraceae bacterium]|nr:succinate--CoA ligase subunit alpha [Phycisphaeraceae bacterium]MCW5753644.1 succinate--CoA ligase subunit alpha [Phycisphaeraceae bacterium]